MSTFSRSLIFLVLISVGLTCGCGTDNHAATNNFPVVAFSDIHFNPFDDPSLCSSLAAADISQWVGLFQGSIKQTPSQWQNDTNYPLLVLALSSLKQNLGASPMVIYTGDLLGHGFPQKFAQDCGTQDPLAMQAFADKTVAFVTAQIRASVGNVPVMFALGNSDSYTGYGPDSIFLANTAELFYTNFLNSGVDHQTFLNTFTAAGCYAADLAGSKLRVIGLNTILFSPLVPGNNDLAVAAELAWLDSTLASAKGSGKKVWLLMHVPPGADIGTTASSADNSGHISTAAMMWKPDYQASFLQILAKYPGLVTLALAGHTHMDEFRVISPDAVIDITPAVSPVFGNNPGYKIFSFNRYLLAPADYQTMTYDLATMPAEFKSGYTFSAAYSMPGALNSSLPLLYSQIGTNPQKEAFYRQHYYSGNSSLNPATGANWNAISDTNWPVYDCGIGNMEAQDLIDCVNSH